jgi:spore coat polysaccharide biosynthesis predicted glycosyltransferase SpsG
LVHADAGQFEGWGHLRESLEVAKALRQRGVKSLVVVPAGVPGAAAEAENDGFDVAEVPPSDWQAGEAPIRVSNLLATRGIRYALCDLVKVPGAYARSMDASTKNWACITELPEDEVAPLNINISTSPEYVPMGGSFRGAHKHQINPTIRQVLICYGGSDPRNVTGKTLEWLRPSIANGTLAGEVRIKAILGPLFAHAEEVRSAARDYPVPVHVCGPLSPRELAQIALDSDIAVTTSGGTMYEFSALGLPSIVVPILPKHVVNARVLEERGVVVRTRLYDEVTP